jgi:hypothetical protein
MEPNIVRVTLNAASGHNMPTIGILDPAATIESRTITLYPITDTELLKVLTEADASFAYSFLQYETVILTTYVVHIQNLTHLIKKDHD